MAGLFRPSPLPNLNLKALVTGWPGFPQHTPASLGTGGWARVKPTGDADTHVCTSVSRVYISTTCVHQYHAWPVVSTAGVTVLLGRPVVYCARPVARRAGCLHCGPSVVRVAGQARGVWSWPCGCRAAGACIRVAQFLGCCPASGHAVPQGRVPELGVLRAYSAWPVVSTAGVLLVLPVVYCAC